MLMHRGSTTAAAVIATIALAAPTASARPAIDPPAHTAAPSPTTPAVRPPADGGLEWASTALGAGGATLVIALTGAGVAAVSRRRHTKVPAAF
jgi:hypothetical protein